MYYLLSYVLKFKTFNVITRNIFLNLTSPLVFMELVHLSKRISTMADGSAMYKVELAWLNMDAPIDFLSPIKRNFIFFPLCWSHFYVIQFNVYISMLIFSIFIFDKFCTENINFKAYELYNIKNYMNYFIFGTSTVCIRVRVWHFAQILHNWKTIRNKFLWDHRTELYFAYFHLILTFESKALYLNSSWNNSFHM